jgi:methylated-DNA-[protein]-cysteine S-methyltransferase
MVGSYFYKLMTSSFGTFGIVWRETNESLKVSRIFLPNEQTFIQDLIQSDFYDIPQSSHYMISELGEQIQDFLNGGDIVFDLDMIAFERCSEFQQRVLFAEYSIPRGWVSTYGRIAKHLGVEGGGRAIGRALANNPFPLVVPCHRTIRSNGELGGYQGGKRMKRMLLELEGVKVSGSGRVLFAKMCY